MERKDTRKETQIEHIDYKDIVRLRAFMNPHSRMFNRARTGLTAREQRDFARAVKRARYMSLVPYVSH